MSWPTWVDEIARRYLADEASVFVVHGDVEAAQWSAEGVAQPLDAPHLLVRFLRRSREVVGLLHPGPPPARLEFADYTDRAKFETLVRAADVLAGKALPLVETDPMHCLGRIWRSLSTVGTAQAYLVADTERLMPAAKKWLEPVPGAPGLPEWASHPQLRRSNNLVVFFCRSLDGVRPEFLGPAVARVALRDVPRRAAEAPAPADALEAVVEVEPSDEVAAPPPADPVPAPAVAAPAAPPPPPEEGGGLSEDLERAIVECLGVHSEESRPARVPVMAAVARVLEAHAPGRFGALRFAWDAESGVQIEGEGADAFRAAWSGDIALDAAAGMILGKLPAGYKPSGSTAFDPTGMKALTRRVQRILSR